MNPTLFYIFGATFVKAIAALIIFMLQCSLSPAMWATTIACTNDSMAADSQTTAETADGTPISKRYEGSKIYVCKKRGTVIGAGGDVKDIHKFLDWYMKDKPLPEGWKGEFAAIEVDVKTRTCRIYRGTLEPSDERPLPQALGSGQDTALAALLCGKDAPAAIALAEELDIYTGGPVSVVDFNDPELKIKTIKHPSTLLDHTPAANQSAPATK